MRVLVIIAHANPKSFNHAVLEAFTRGLKDGGHSFEVVDLYAIKFDPSLKLEEFPIVGIQTPKDVLEQQEKVAQADALALIYPIIWMNFPAILKGWLERVFNYGFAYNLTEAGMLQGDLSGRIGMLEHKKALLINTTAWSEASYRETPGMLDAMEKIMVEYALKYPGISNVEHIFLYQVPTVSDETRKEYLELAYRLGREF